MLKSWFIQNFKPILDSGELQLAPVTVLAGLNSSGKSSLIQSILMIAQTLSNRILDRALLPNGPIVQLGTFEDILSEQTDLRTLAIGFELELRQEQSRFISNGRIRRAESPFTSRYNTDIKSIKIRSQFRSASNIDTNASAIEASKVNVESVSLDVVASLNRHLANNKQLLATEDEVNTNISFRFDIKQLSPEELEKFLQNVTPEHLRLIPYTNVEPNYMGEFSTQYSSLNSRPLEALLVNFSHFLPRKLIRKYDRDERHKAQIINTVGLILEIPVQSMKTPPTALDEFIKESLDVYNSNILFKDSDKDKIAKMFKSYNIDIKFSENTLNDFLAWYQLLKPLRSKRQIKSKVQDLIVQIVLEQMPKSSQGTEGLEVATNNAYVENLERAVDQTTQFFTSKIRYLGPLRADPQAAQKFAPSSELDDVGSKGEYAAAVYDANYNAIILWYNPFNEKTENSTLKVALNTWIRYLRVADEVQIQMAGQSGVSWQVVHMTGSRARPLTAVGVGVSQILPILVMGLLAPSDTLLLVEQPELHLHPRVQARLGDFFMGLAKCDKQCLIETHSENLVNQLRYRIVEAGGQEHSDCLIYFVDQDEQGASRFNPVEVSAQGNIQNWPDGFFDETMLQEDRITAASLKNRVKKQGRNDQYRA